MFVMVRFPGNNIPRLRLRARALRQFLGGKASYGLGQIVIRTKRSLEYG